MKHIFRNLLQAIALVLFSTGFAMASDDECSQLCRWSGPTRLNSLNRDYHLSIKEVESGSLGRNIAAAAKKKTPVEVALSLLPSAQSPSYCFQEKPLRKAGCVPVQIEAKPVLIGMSAALLR